MTETQTFIAALLALATVPSAALAAVAYLARHLLNQAAAKDLEKFKKDLSITQFEHQTKFSNMYQRRAEVIAELYKKLAATHRKAEILTQPLQQDSSKVDGYKIEAADAFNEAAEFFTLHKLFLTTSSEKKCELVLKEMREAFFKFEQGSGLYGGGVQAAELFAAWGKIKDDTGQLLTELSVKFRDVLGIPDKKIEGSSL